jgi:hypothetical protein
MKAPVVDAETAAAIAEIQAFLAERLAARILEHRAEQKAAADPKRRTA